MHPRLHRHGKGQARIVSYYQIWTWYEIGQICKLSPLPDLGEQVNPSNLGLRLHTGQQRRLKRHSNYPIHSIARNK